MQNQSNLIRFFVGGLLLMLVILSSISYAVAQSATQPHSTAEHTQVSIGIAHEQSSVKNANHIFKTKLSPLQEVALWVTNHVGTMGFFLILVGWTVIWLFWNAIAPKKYRFDPYPGFVLWLFISNLIQIALMPLLMIGQNLQGIQASAKADVDFEVNKKTERQVNTLIKQLNIQHESIKRLHKKLDAQHNKMDEMLKSQ